MLKLVLKIEGQVTPLFLDSIIVPRVGERIACHQQAHQTTVYEVETVEYTFENDLSSKYVDLGVKEVK